MFISVLLLNILATVFAACAVVAAYCKFWLFFQAVIVTSTKSPYMCMFFVSCVLILRPTYSNSLSTSPGTSFL